MTIGVATVVPDGIALAADTQTTWIRAVTKAKEKSTGNEIELAEPLKETLGWSQGARKLFPVRVGGKTFAIITAGQALLGSKTMFAVFRSGAHAYEGSNPTCAQAMTHFVVHLKQELASHLKCDVSELAKQPFILPVHSCRV
jgi:hypothetical protein